MSDEQFIIVSSQAFDIDDDAPDWLDETNRS